MCVGGWVVLVCHPVSSFHLDLCSLWLEWQTHSVSSIGTTTKAHTHAHAPTYWLVKFKSLPASLLWYNSSSRSIRTKRPILMASQFAQRRRSVKRTNYSTIKCAHQTRTHSHTHTHHHTIPIQDRNVCRAKQRIYFVAARERIPIILYIHTSIYINISNMLNKRTHSAQIVRRA